MVHFCAILSYLCECRQLWAFSKTSKFSICRKKIRLCGEQWGYNFHCSGRDRSTTTHVFSCKWKLIASGSKNQLPFVSTFLMPFLVILSSIFIFTELPRTHISLSRSLQSKVNMTHNFLIVPSSRPIFCPTNSLFIEQKDTKFQDLVDLRSIQIIHSANQHKLPHGIQKFNRSIYQSMKQQTFFSALAFCALGLSRHFAVEQ